MDCYPLDITVISADGIKNVNMITKMDVYVVISINGDPSTARKSHADKEAGSSPRWNHHVRFDLDDYTIKHRSLLFVLKSDRALGDKDIGEVSVPISELFDKSVAKDDDSSAKKLPAEERVMEYQVRTTSGKMKGTLKFSYKFGEKYTREIAAPPPPPAAAAKAFNEPVMAYPAGPSGSYPSYPPQPGMMYPGAPAHGAPYPYAAPPPQAGYAGYPPPPQQGYVGGYGGYPPAGYPPQPMGYGGYQQPQQPKKKKGGSKLGLGLGAGLLGGLLVGDMIGDVGEMAAYDAGYDDGFGDGGDFDF